MELIERGVHLDALANHLAVAAKGNRRLVLVGGEAGVGKTSLVRAFCEQHADNVRIVRGACDGLFTPQARRRFAVRGGQAGDRELVPPSAWTRIVRGLAPRIRRRR